MSYPLSQEVIKQHLRSSQGDPSEYLLYLFSNCSVFVQYLFSHSLDKYWTSTGRQLDNTIRKYEGSPWEVYGKHYSTTKK